MNKRTVLYLICLATAAFAVYGNTLKGEFVWDDLVVQENPYIRDFSHLKDIFTKDLGEGIKQRYGFYRPIQLVSYMFDYSMWKLRPLGYHLTNIILHTLAAMCLYWLLCMLFGDLLIAFAAALIFTVHPLYTAAVAYISGRADPLAAIFILLTLVFYIKNLRSGRVLFFAISLLSCALALMSRENALILPVLLLIYHAASKEKIRAARFAAIALMPVIYIALRFAFLNYLSPHLAAKTTIVERLPGFLVAMTEYFRLIILPLGLHMEYGAKSFGFTDYRALTGAAILISLLAYAFRSRRKAPAVFFGIMWFFAALLPSSNIYPINAFMAEHWMYVPAMGIFLVLGYLFKEACDKPGLKRRAVMFLAVAVAFYSFLTIRQNSYWNNEIEFYRKTLEYSPDSPKMYNNLGKLYNDRREFYKSIPLFKKSIELDPKNKDAYYNMGLAYNLMGENTKALECYMKAIELNPYEVKAFNNIGAVYNEMKQYAEAARYLKRAIELEPGYANAYSGYGTSCAFLGNYEEAIAAFRRGIDLGMDSSEIRYNIGLAYLLLNRNSEAIAELKKSITFMPDNAKAHASLSEAYYRQGRYDEAIIECDKAASLGHAIDPRFLELIRPYRKEQ